MGKHEAMTPKAIAKKIKAAGLQKLRWYCQMCNKQCRDANGFKCHIESESHSRNMMLFASNPNKHMDEFSTEFETGFMDILKRRFRSKRVHANLIYNEYIKDRHHTHMNATKWVTLTGFILYLGKSGKAKVEETPKGWYLTYIERDPEVLAKNAKVEKKEQMDVDDAQREQKEIDKRVKFFQEKGMAAAPDDSYVPSELDLNELGNTKIGFSLKPKSNIKKTDESSNSNSTNTPSTTTSTTSSTSTSSEESKDELLSNFATVHDYELEGDDGFLPVPEEDMDALEEGKETDQPPPSLIKKEDNESISNNNNNNNNNNSPSVLDTPIKKEVTDNTSSSSSNEFKQPPPKSIPNSIKTEPTTTQNNINPTPSPTNTTKKRPADAESNSTPPSRWDKKGEDHENNNNNNNNNNSNNTTNTAKSTAPKKLKEADTKKPKLSPLEEIRRAEEAKKERLNRKDYWLTENIVVKVVNKNLAEGKYYKQKGVVKKVFDKYVGLIRMLDSGDVLKIDQAQLETVIPNIGQRVSMVNGAYRGEEATLLSIDMDQFKAKVRLETGPHLGTTVNADYEYICKIYKQ